MLPSCNNNNTRFSTDQWAAKAFIDSIIKQDSVVSIEIIDFFSCTEDTIAALFNDNRYESMVSREIQIDNQIIDERYKMSEYEYNADRHRWEIERLQDAQNILKEEMEEYKKHYCPPIIEDVALVRYFTKHNSTYRYICLQYNRSHNKVIRKIENASKCGFTIFRVDNKYGIKLSGYNDTILQPKYDRITRFSDYDCTCFLLRDKEKYGLFDDTLGIVIPPEFDSIIIKSGFYVKPIYVVKRQDTWGMFNNTGKNIIPAEYDGILLFSKGYTSDISDGDTICFVKKGGEQKGFWFGRGNPAVTDDGLWGVYSTSGKQMVPCEYGFNNIPDFQ